MPTTLRRIVDAVAMTAAFGLVGIGGWYGYSEVDHRRDMKKASEELRRFQQILAFHAASGQTQISSRGWPTTIDPSWFGDNPPRNPLVSNDRPWVEIAPIEHAHMSHPPVRIALDRSLAMFWYNPYQGVVRARVATQISDHRSLAFYNQANSTSVTTLFDLSTPPETVEPKPEAQTATVPDDEER